MNWKIKAILQKILAFTTIGERLNHIPVTINKKYHYNVTLYQTYECIRKFSLSTIDLDNKSVALEIGTGYSIIASVVLSLLGFQKIVSVDITKDIRFSTFKKQVKYLEVSEIFQKIVSKSIYTENDLKNKIEEIQNLKSFENVFDLLNISYIAPYNFEDISNYNIDFQYVTSQVVLEHMQPNDLNDLFESTKKWLDKDGFCIHTINFIDHFANPGFFQDKSISEFNFLKYSNVYWNFWSGNSIAYTNRLSYIYYLELCEKYNLKVIDFIGENYRDRKELDLKMIHSDVIKKYNSIQKIEELTKYQRGTLVIKS